NKGGFSMKRFWLSIAVSIAGVALLVLSLGTGRAGATPPVRGAFGFNAPGISGFPTGAVSLIGGGAYNLATGFVKSAGGFGCLADVLQGPLSHSINPDDPGPCLAGEGVRWDTV